MAQGISLPSVRFERCVAALSRQLDDEQCSSNATHGMMHCDAKRGALVPLEHSPSLGDLKVLDRFFILHANGIEEWRLLRRASFIGVALSFEEHN